MDTLDLHPRILTAINKVKLSNVGQILSMSGPDLERATSLGQNDVLSLQKALATHVQENPPVSGGIPTRGITEIAGESASGKTQLCLQLCISSQLPKEQKGLNAGAVYICTEDVFPNKRLIQMVRRMQQRSSMDAGDIAFTDNIFIEHASEIKDLWFCINKKVPLLLSSGRVRLIIIDSIAALFRCEFEAHETVRRAKELSSFAARLHQLSHQYSIPVICVNQVSDVVNSSAGLTSRKVIPALGLSWSNLVTTRLMLSRSNCTIHMDQASGAGIEASVRRMEVIFAPHLPNVICEYIIDADGVKGLA